MTIHAAHASPSSGRLLLSFALMPVINFLLALVAFPTLQILREQGRFQMVVGDDHGTYVLAVLTGLIAVVVTVAGAVPVAFTLMKRGPVSLKQTLIAGLGLGNAPVAVIALFMSMFAVMHVVNGTITDHLVPLRSLAASGLLLVAVGSMFGIASAAVFFGVAIRGTDASTSTARERR
jgi:hypothetical protein